MRVPVFVGHSEAVHLEFEHPLDEDEAREILREAPGVVVVDKHDRTGYVTPKEAQGEFAVFVSRIRNDPTVEHGLTLWVVSDNLRKGAALNAVQIAQLAARARPDRAARSSHEPPRRGAGRSARQALAAASVCYIIWGAGPGALHPRRTGGREPVGDPRPAGALVGALGGRAGGRRRPDTAIRWLGVFARPRTAGACSASRRC